MSDSTQDSNSFPDFRTGPLITGAVLIGAGVVVALAGLAVGGSHLFSATRRWIQEMDVPPSEVAKLKWAQARTAAAAGTTAWRNGVQADVSS
ncbi:MAG: hypothetical protein ACLPKE_23760 [Streptosporangiaceae bacterium]